MSFAKNDPPGAIRNWPDLKDAELVVIPTADYEMCILPLASVDEAAGQLLKAGRLEKELAASSGFGGVTGLEVVQVNESGTVER